LKEIAIVTSKHAEGNKIFKNVFPDKQPEMKMLE
jgi:hypothetical protein